MAVTTFTESDYDPVFKVNYLKLGDNLYNSFDNVVSQVKKTFGTLGGKHSRFPIEITFGGGVGSSSDGTLPEPENTEYLEPVLSAKRCYARIKIDGLTIESSAKSEHAFVKAIDQEVTGKLKSFNRKAAAEFFNDGTGALGQFSGSAGGTASAPTMTILNTGTYKRRHAFFEKGDFVNVNTLTSVFKITAYNRSSGLLTLSRVSGSDDLTSIGAGTHTLYWQNSKDADPYGLLGITVANTTHYTVAEEFRYEPFTLDTAAGGAPLNTGMLTEVIEKIETEMDEPPTHIVMSPKQYSRYISLLEDQKRFPVPTEMKIRKNAMTSKKLLARVSYSGIQYAGSQGGINILKNKFVRDDMIYFLNMSHIEQLHVKKPGWRAKDNMIFLRMEDQDAYEARYVCYKENLFNPAHVGYIEDLDVS